MTRAVLSIGSNLGDRLDYLRSVVAEAGDALVAASGVYETAPWGGVDQQPFLNAVLMVDRPSSTPEDWWQLAQRCEAAAERTREVRWGPRTLDVDIVAAYDEHMDLILSDDSVLTLPHPRAHERAFVLAPWVEIAPDALLPQGPIEQLLTELTATGDPQQQLTRTTLELR